MIIRYSRLINYKTFGDNNLWEDKNTYYLHKYSQGTKEWKINRIYKITGSNIVKAIDYDKDCPREKYLDNMIYDQSLNIDLKINENDRGIYHENITRKKYEDKYNVKIVQVGSASPKNEPRISSSTDGVIYKLINNEWVETDTIVEIKCPKKIPFLINRYLNNLKNGFKPYKWYHKHIRDSTYIQMQMQMYILNKKFCIYIIDPEEGDMYIEKIPFNIKYINENIIPKLNEFFIMMDLRIDEMVKEYIKNIEPKILL